MYIVHAFFANDGWLLKQLRHVKQEQFSRIIGNRNNLCKILSINNRHITDFFRETVNFKTSNIILS